MVPSWIWVPPFPLCGPPMMPCKPTCGRRGDAYFTDGRGFHDCGTGKRTMQLRAKRRRASEASEPATRHGQNSTLWEAELLSGARKQIALEAGGPVPVDCHGALRAAPTAARLSAWRQHCASHRLHWGEGGFHSDQQAPAPRRAGGGKWYMICGSGTGAPSFRHMSLIFLEW